MHPIELKEKISNGDFEVLQNALHFFGLAIFLMPEIESVQEEETSREKRKEKN